MKYLKILVCLLLLNGCSSQEKINIAGGNTSERQILAQIVKQMIEHYEPNIPVGIINNLGSTTLIVEAMNHGDAQIAGTMYTGTSLVGELKQESITDSTEAFEVVVREYYKQYNRIWFPSFGFDNTYAFMVKKEYAQTHNLKTVSDLEKLSSEARVGIDTSWMSRDGDGYESFKDLYGYQFTNIYPMDISLVYTALDAGEMEVALGYSTDGRIDAYDLVVLEDDLHLFPSYDANILIDSETLKTYPELEIILLKLENSISNDTMQQLNKKSDEDRIEPYVVAQEFLEHNNYFENVNPVSLSNRPDYSFMEVSLNE